PREARRAVMAPVRSDDRDHGSATCHGWRASNGDLSSRTLRRCSASNGISFNYNDLDGRRAGSAAALRATLYLGIGWPTPSDRAGHPRFNRTVEGRLLGYNSGLGSDLARPKVSDRGD